MRHCHYYGSKVGKIQYLTSKLKYPPFCSLPILHSLSKELSLEEHTKRIEVVLLLNPEMRKIRILCGCLNLLSVAVAEYRIVCKL
jgi:hypothetical protein